MSMPGLPDTKLPLPLPRLGGYLAHGFLLADTEVEGRPSVNDLATLLAHAMQRPLTQGAHRPRVSGT